MAQNAVKSYFLSPSFDWPAEGGPVKLGAIITDRKKPHQSITIPSTEPTSVYKSEKLNWEDAKWKKKNWFATVFGQFLSALGFGLNVGADGDWSQADFIKCDKLETKEFVPDVPYLKTRMQDAAVQAYLKKNRIKAYMVTGIKVAYNPVAYQLKTRGLHANMEVALGTGAPKQGLGAGSDTGSRTAQTGGTNIIYAYRLTGINYEIKEDGSANVKTWEEEGRYMGVDTENPTPKAKGPDTTVVEFRGFTEVDTDGDGLGPPVGIVDELDEEVCVCVVVKPDQRRGFGRSVG